MTTQTIEGWGLQLARLLCAIADNELDNATIATVKSRLLHAFGVSLANSRLPAAEAAWRAIEGSVGDHLVFGRKERVGAEDAAFVNAAIGHGSLLEDCGPGGLREGSHPSTFIIPAALAAAEMAGATGKQLIVGVLVGYEAVSRLGAAAPPTIVQRRFRPLAVMGAFGAAAATATILGARPEQLASALAIAANLAGGTTQGIFEGSMEPYFQASFAARNGLLAAKLGIAGAHTSKQAFEGEFGFFQAYGGEQGNLHVMLEPRRHFGVSAVGAKRFAACLQNQETLALIVDDLRRPFDASQVERVVIRRPAAGGNGLNSPGVSRTAPFDNMLTAQMSARFTAAAALLGLPVHDPAFYNARHNDPAIVALTRKIDLEPSDDPSVSVSIHLRGGQVIILDADKSQVLFPDGGAVRDAFLNRAKTALGDAAEGAAKIIDALDALDDIRALTSALTERV